MSAAWAVQRTRGQTGWIDAVWTFGVGATGAALAALPLGGGSGWRRAVVALAVVLWGLRLGAHIVARTRKAPDDPRYRKLIEAWGAAAPIRLFGFLQAQALVGAVLAVLVALAANAPPAVLRAQDAVGLALFAVALAGEGAADAELARFKANPANRGRICDVGLWGRSRHPNYFFEWLVWAATVGHGDRRRRWAPRLDRPRLDVRRPALRFGRAASRGAYAANARRGVPRLSAAHARLLSQNSVIAGRPTTFGWEVPPWRRVYATVAKRSPI